MKSIRLLLLTISLLFMQFSFAASTLDTVVKKGVLRVGIDVGYMPFEMRAKNGQIIGFDIDIAKAMAKAMGVKLELVNTSFDGMIASLLTDKFDLIIAGMTITPSRNLKVNFSDPYIQIGQSVLIAKDKAQEYTNYKDLNKKGLTVISRLGTTSEIVVDKHLALATNKKFETEAEGVLELVNGRADAFVYDFPYNSVYAAQHTDKVVHLSTPFTYEPLGIAMKRGDVDTLNFVNNFLKQIKGDGTYDKFYQKWFESKSWLDQVQ